MILFEHYGYKFMLHKYWGQNSKKKKNYWKASALGYLYPKQQNDKKQKAEGWKQNMTFLSREPFTTYQMTCSLISEISQYSIFTDNAYVAELYFSLRQ